MGETAVERTETTQQIGIGTWILGALAVLGITGILIFFLTRRREESISIYDRTDTIPTRPI